MHNSFDVYLAKIKSVLQGVDSFQTKSRYFIYSLFGVNQKSFLWERIVQERLGNGPFEVMDLGGGLGFLAAELALKGHSLKVVDNNPDLLEMCHWIGRRCGIEDRFSPELGDFHDVVYTDVKERYDVISYFGSLLYAGRDQTPDIIRASMQMLKPGGLLLIHEGPRESATPGTEDYGLRFHAKELDGYLRDCAGAPTYYNVFTGAKMPWEMVQNRVMMAEVQKKGC
jgi:SAM-dependent methyltransferase